LDLDLTDPNVVYTFNRKREDGFIGCDAIVNFLVNKTRYFEIGGHDEDYSGHYGREETFFFHCLQYHRVRIVRCCDIFLPWYPKIGGTRGLVRNKSHNTLLFDRKMVELKAGRYKNGVMLRFNWKLTNNL
ncbi:MAG: hypothetical protein ABSE48_22965, partial [Verrucomicrobiota bacterium]